MVRDFRAGTREFFVSGARAQAARRPRTRAGRGSSSCAGRALDRRDRRSARPRTAPPLNRTGVAEVIAAEGLRRLWRRPDAERGAPGAGRSSPRRGVDFAELPARVRTKLAGLLLTLPDLVALDLPGIVAAAGYPGTAAIPAVSLPAVPAGAEARPASAGSRTSTTSPPTPAPRCSPGSPRSPRPPR